MADEKNTTGSEPISTVDPYEYLQITPHPNGTITRRFIPPTVPPSATTTTTTTLALSKDHPLNPQTKTWLRLFLPKNALNNPDYYHKLPILLYYHGGGFLLFNADSKLFHDFCELLAATTPALVVSVDYRLAPEHRLPAAYDDAVDSLSWIKKSLAQPDEDDNWISRYGDFSSCFLMGSSSGGNIAYIAGLRASSGPDLGPVRIRGLILHTPFFGGVDRAGSERRLADNPNLPVSATDLMWELALPEGADRDHEYSNPMKGGGPGELDRVRELGWKVLLTGCTGDPLIDRQVEFAKVLEERGIGVVTHITEGGYHGVDIKDPTLTPSLIEVVKNFIFSTLSENLRPSLSV